MYSTTTGNEKSRSMSFLDKSFEGDINTNPLQNYNYFIRCYNTEENMVDNVKLEELRPSSAFDTFWSFTSNRFYFFLVFLLILVPVVGIFFSFWIFAFVIIHFSRMKTVNQNASKVANPLQNMVYCPPLCRNTNSKFFEIKIQDLEGFTFNNEMIAKLKVKQTEGAVKFMVYNDEFQKFYTEFGNMKTRNIFYFLIAFFFLGGQLSLFAHLMTALMH